METQIAIPNNRLHNADSSRVDNVHTFYSQLQRLRTKIIYIAYDRDFHKIAIENIKKKKPTDSNTLHTSARAIADIVYGPLRSVLRSRVSQNEKISRYAPAADSRAVGR